MLFDHIYIDNQAPKTLILLHGTGGSKSDFLFLNDFLQKRYNLLALQGNVLEQGMARFFERTGAGVFDQNSIKAETKKLHAFINDWCAQHNCKPSDLVFWGYSNGANMILATLFYYPQSVFSAVLLHPMLPFTPEPISLHQHNFLVTIGLHDPMVSLTDQQAVVEILEKNGAAVTTKKHEGGHELTRDQIAEAVDFLSF
jgi:phospholipase/carboxylesterase